ncbi:hypothetical protein WMY93_023331 [Mugilogobius chulae]|uniref:Uncharacterized protein n=1 Tax=Mugilogobius chulae TaxID=88201 RepID=A0AAW0NEH2_9GOBI
MIESTPAPEVKGSVEVPVAELEPSEVPPPVEEPISSPEQVSEELVLEGEVPPVEVPVQEPPAQPPVDTEPTSDFPVLLYGSAALALMAIMAYGLDERVLEQCKVEKNKDEGARGEKADKRAEQQGAQEKEARGRHLVSERGAECNITSIGSSSNLRYVRCGDLEAHGLGGFFSGILGPAARKVREREGKVADYLAAEKRLSPSST